jgi:RNA polymerase sigma factor (sigma-70 family)
MRLRAKRYDLDLEGMSDEELVVLAQECGCAPAGQVLLLRHHDWVGGLVARRARRRYLQDADVEDARQNAVLSLTEAVHSYDTLELGRPGGCRFRSFLYRVALARYCDFLRKVGRLTGRWKTFSALAEAPVPVRSGCDDPAAAAEWQEAQARLERALGQLDDPARQLWERLVSGALLRGIADELSVSYDAAKRARPRGTKGERHQSRGCIAWQ